MGSPPSNVDCRPRLALVGGNPYGVYCRSGQHERYTLTFIYLHKAGIFDFDKLLRSTESHASENTFEVVAILQESNSYCEGGSQCVAEGQP